MPQASTSSDGRDLWPGTIAPEPSIIGKKKSQNHSSSSVSHKIVKAPRVMAKSTGGFFPQTSKRGHRPAFGSRSSSPLVYRPDVYDDMANVQSTSSFNPENGILTLADLQQGWFSRLDSMFAEGKSGIESFKITVDV